MNKLRQDAKIILDEYYIKIGNIGKSRNELEEILKNEIENKHLQERSVNELKKDDIIAFIKEWEKSKEVIDRYDRNINHIKKQIEVLDSGNVNTLSEARTRN